MKITNQRIIYAIGALLVTSFLLLVWLRYRNHEEKESMTMLPQNNIYFNNVSGQTEFRNKQYQNNNYHEVRQNGTNTSQPYLSVPMEDNIAHVTGMNEYLWDKSKRKN